LTDPAPAAPTERRLLGDLADAVPHLVWVATPDGIVREFSRRLIAYGHARREGEDGWRWELLVHPDDLGETAAAWDAAVGADEPYEHEYRLRMADGTYRWHLSRAVPVTDAATGERHWYGTATDIHDVRQAEEQLRRTQSSLALAMRGGRMGWWQRDLVTNDVTWSPELEELFGLPVGSFAGKESAFFEFVHPDDRAALEDAVAGAVATRTDYVIEFRFRRADGTWGWMEGRGRATYEADRATILYGIGIDITERKEAEEAVGRREERLRLATEVGGFGLYDFDLRTGAIYWSPELRRMVLWEADEPAAPELAPVHPDDREAILAQLAASQEPLSDGIFDAEYRIIRLDGAVRWVAVHGQTFFSSPDPSPDRVALRAIGVVVDISDRKQADELRDVFVGMLSHELRTPVTSIYGGSQMLRRSNLDEVTRRDIVEDIVTESERLERLVENLLVLARAERNVVLGGQDPVLVRPIIERVVADKRRRWPGAVIVSEVAADLPPTTWDEGSFELVLRNLLSNALKYGDEGGEVAIRAWRDDDMIEIAVADHGAGLPPGDPARLFDLFYRTDDAKRRAQGAGIGLFVVRALVESVGGRVWARDHAGGGAEFGLSLPIYVDSDDFGDG
jgi:PAS domain S-box-containing protein